MTETDQLTRYLREQLIIDDLPLGIYVVDKDGQLVDCNGRLREILQLSADQPIEGSKIAGLYWQSDDRKAMTHEVDNATPRGGFVENRINRIRVKGQTKWVSDTCRALQHPQTGNLVGYVGYLTDVTEEITFRKVFDQLPAGVYRLDQNDCIAVANDAFARMLGYDSPSEILGRNITEFYARPDDVRATREMAIVHDSISRVTAELVKRTGERIHVSLSATQITESDGSYAGREGMVLDVTEEVTYRELLNEMPVGTYVTRLLEGRDILMTCNSAFARNFGYSQASELEGVSFAKFYQDSAGYERLMSEMHKAHKHGKPLLGYRENLKKRDGTPITIELNAQFLLDGQGSIVGRAGVTRDISDEAALWDMKEDIGRTLHHYTSTLMKLEQVLESVTEVLTRRSVSGRTVNSVSRAHTIVPQLAMALAERIADLINSEHHECDLAAALPESERRLLETMMLNLTDFQQRIPHPSLRIPSVQDAASITLRLLSAVELSGGANARLQSALNVAQDLERICCLISILEMEDSIREMDHEVRSLREFVTFHRRAPEPMRLNDLSNLVAQAISNLQRFAKSRNVEIVFVDRSKGCSVQSHDRHLVRAIANLLHNAIKYSWQRPQERSSVVRVRLEALAEEAVIEIENYGVPITQRELRQGLPFEIGYRGAKSGDRGRLGTGVGLFDTKQIALEHGGLVALSSRPVGQGVSTDETNSGPFVTTATLRLPVQRPEEV